jgi:twinkle protein
MKRKTEEAFRPINHAIRKIVDRFYPEDDECIPGFVLPWAKITNKGFVFRDGEFTVWSGINGHGKSMMLSQVMLESIKQRHKIFMASFEMPADRTGHRIVRQALGKPVDCVDDVVRCIEWLSQHFIVNTFTDRMDYKELLTHMQVFCQQGCTQFVIDSLMKCGIMQDDYNSISDFMDLLQNFAQKNGVHVHLVAHSRKGSEDDAPGKMEIKGPIEISNIPDNIISVWRNKAKEQNQKTSTPYDCSMTIGKSREYGESENIYGLYYHQGTFQYLEHENDKPVRYYDDNY